MNFNDVMRAVSATGTVHHAQDAIRQVHGRGSTSWVAEQAGISARTARRWMSATPPPSRRRNIIDMAGAGAVAAQKIRSSRTINVGRVRVKYDDEDAGTRQPTKQAFNIADIAGMDAFYDALAADDYRNAARHFSDAIINSYSPGLHETLTIYEFESGLELGS